MNKGTIKKLVPACIWSKIREKTIVYHHSKVARICKKLIDSFFTDYASVELPKAKIAFPEGTKIIWQYWAQGFDNLPRVVRECFASIDKYSGDYLIVRLSDATINDYVNIPQYILEKKAIYGLAHFSDILRLILLNAYGGIWIDATIMLTGPIPEKYLCHDFFAFQRNSEEQRKDYWKNSYAYYFSWAKGFHVKMLSSFIVSKPRSTVISVMCGSLLKWWESNSFLPDYFFIQILFDVLIEGRLHTLNCPIVSDCPPHYLQQFRNDPNFFIKSEEEICKLTSIHKLTYK